MKVICLRLGQPFPSKTGQERFWRSDARKRGIMVDLRDVARAVECSLVTDISYGVYPIVSASDVSLVDTTANAELGYRPVWKFTEGGLISLAERNSE